MHSALSRTIDWLRQPEYTGENRCIPCTAVNMAIAVVLAAAAAIAVPPAGPVVLGVSLGAIYFRGYLVPGTPTLTKRYFPDWLLAAFDKAPADFEAPEATDVGRDGANPEETLLDAGVVAPCDDVDDLCLADDVREAWRERVVEYRDGDRERQVAAFLGVDPDGVAVASRGETDAVGARVDGGLAGRWESEAALLADIAGADVLADRVDGWGALSVQTRSRVASGLRAFVEVCPTCDGPISIDEETVESCCRSRQVYAVTCDDCGSRILEVAQ
ncbi:hypothetical protein [Salinilacihabitans rarus]|uniref:hypothetical protein n=1 Tax=Salinilacihabitans rarus TaxID=2961596 RepID=UPI0020C8EDF3|nr:hypothetical protein [Salinilacihabitans rarus]